MSLITPRTLKGFRDYLPATMMPREQLIETARRVYRSYGFSPIDTPALEYLEILTGKGSAETDRQLYQFVDHGGRPVGLRFDLTVPLARFVAQHAAELGTPFKRYHIATVWRGENTQRGRYREFMQCDFDTIGTTSVVADIETALVIHDLLLAIGFTDFTIHINNRMVLNGLLEKLELADQSTHILRALDKLTKIGPENVIREMELQAAATREQALAVLRLGELHGTADEILRQLDPLLAGSDKGTAGVESLRQVMAGVQAAGVPAQRVRINVSIARGLDYYTGTIFETLLDAKPDMGSVCSGGRYDNLAGLFTKQELPGIGAFARPGPSAGRHGGAGDAREGHHPRAGADRLLLPEPAAHVPAARRSAPRHRPGCRAVSRAKTAGPAVEVRGSARLSRGLDRR